MEKSPPKTPSPPLDESIHISSDSDDDAVVAGLNSDENGYRQFMSKLGMPVVDDRLSNADQTDAMSYAVLDPETEKELLKDMGGVAGVKQPSLSPSRGEWKLLNVMNEINKPRLPRRKLPVVDPRLSLSPGRSSEACIRLSEIRSNSASEENRLKWAHAKRAEADPTNINFRNQAISSRRAITNYDFRCILNDALGFVYGILYQLLENMIRATEAHIGDDAFNRIVDEIMSQSRDEKEIENIFAQFDKRGDEEKEMLYFSYRLFLLAQGVCCICHDRLARTVVEFLKQVLRNYKATVAEYRNEALNELYEELSKQFTVSFETSRSGATVGQPKCRDAGEAMIEKYRQWLTSQKIDVDKSLVVYMNKRHDAKKMIAEIVEQKVGKDDMECLSESDKRLFNILADSTCFMADAVGNLMPQKGVYSAGLSSIDAAGGSIDDALFVLFESLEYDVQPLQLPTKKQKSNTDDSVKTNHPPKIRVKCCVWDRDASSDSRKKIALDLRPLSYGAASLVCVSCFNQEDIDDEFMKQLHKNHTNIFFKPFVLMYQPTRSLKFDKECQEAKMSFITQVKQFTDKKKGEILLAAGKVNLRNKYISPRIEHEVMINGEHHTLVSVSLGSISNNMTGAPLARIIPGVEASARGVGFGVGCDDNLVYLGKGQPPKPKKSGQPYSTLEETAGFILLALKQFGDDSKIDALNKLRRIIGKKIGIFGTVDWMAGMTASAFGDIPCVLVSPSNVSVYGSSSNLKISHELKLEIATLQARIQTYKKTHNDMANKALYDELSRQARMDLDLISERMILPHVVEFTRRLEAGDGEMLPSVLSGLFFCDYLEREDFFTTPDTFERIVSSPFSREVHGAISGEEGFAELFANAKRLNQLNGCVDLIESVLLPKKWQIERSRNPPPPTDNFVVKLKSVVEGDKACVNEKENINKWRQLIQAETDPFTLFLQRRNFVENPNEKETRSTKVPLRVILRDYVDPMCVSLLDLQISTNTREGTRWREMSNAALEIVFKHVDKSKIPTLKEDTYGLAESEARKDAEEGNSQLTGELSSCIVVSESIEVDPRMAIWRKRAQVEMMDMPQSGRFGKMSSPNKQIKLQAPNTPPPPNKHPRARSQPAPSKASNSKKSAKATQKVHAATAFASASAKRSSKNVSGSARQLSGVEKKPNFMKETKSSTAKKNQSKSASATKKNPKKGGPKGGPKKGGRQTRKRSKYQNRQLTRKYRENRKE